MTPLLQEKSQIDERVQRLETLRDSSRDVREWLELAQEEQDSDILETLEQQMRDLTRKLREAELKELLGDPEDKLPAILELHPGAGGTEAQDWAEMLMRMYIRWAEDKDFKVKFLDYLEGEEAGVKSATLQIDGPYAYGMLKAEVGIHRLVRMSPFDSSGRRHTSFASVDVYPEAGNEIDIEVRDEDIRVDVYRASGPGGQHVNKTSSAVRITHEPTGIVVQCQNEKSQLRNREHAMKILKSRLYELELNKMAEAKQESYAAKDAIAWGSQIRSYVMQPYRLVKDHRTNTENGNVEAVLDGDLDEFMRNWLMQEHAG
jgi:peptide chain release factor 2